MDYFKQNIITLSPNTKRNNTWTWERKRSSQKKSAEAEDIFTGKTFYMIHDAQSPSSLLLSSLNLTTRTESPSFLLAVSWRLLSTFKSTYSSQRPLQFFATWALPLWPLHSARKQSLKCHPMHLIGSGGGIQEESHSSLPARVPSRCFRGMVSCTHILELKLLHGCLLQS